MHLEMDSTDASKSGYGTTSAPEMPVTQLSISLLSGKTVFGPAAVDISKKQVGDICEEIAKGIEVRPEAVLLVLGEKELNSKKTLQEEGVKTGMEIKAMVLSGLGPPAEGHRRRRGAQGPPRRPVGGAARTS